MRERIGRIALALTLVGGLVGVAAPVAIADEAQVIHYDDIRCSVGWDQDHDSLDENCSGANTKTPNGGYTLVLHGQIQDLTEFEGPTSFATTCGVNYFFWLDGIDSEFVNTDSVRHFTADGKMTETCTYQPSHEPEPAQVIHYDDIGCSVGWDQDHHSSSDQHCSGTNTKTPGGGYTLVLHGQIQDLTGFEGPTSFATTCGVNYFFWFDGIDAEFVLTDSVRHFTADGRMTETCTYQP